MTNNPQDNQELIDTYKFFLFAGSLIALGLALKYQTWTCWVDYLDMQIWELHYSYNNQNNGKAPSNSEDNDTRDNGS